MTVPQRSHSTDGLPVSDSTDLTWIVVPSLREQSINDGESDDEGAEGCGSMVWYRISIHSQVFYGLLEVDDKARAKQSKDRITK